jgi:hypothetical protein
MSRAEAAERTAAAQSCLEELIEKNNICSEVKASC